MTQLLTLFREFLKHHKEPEVNIRFIKSFSPNPDNIQGYEVWSNIYTSHMSCVGFVSDKNIHDTVQYFKEEGYEVEIIDQFVFG